MDAKFWEDRYRDSDQLFSGNPNGVLVGEVAELPGKQALDVGCGEGADAIWLARRGWHVTGIDIARTALKRAAAAAADVADRVAWLRADIAETPPPRSSFDLVSAHYFPLLRAAGTTGPRGLVDAVAPGGTLLVVGHDMNDVEGHDAEDYYQPADLVAFLGDDWVVEVDETRPRVSSAPPGTHHRNDTVLRARRRD